MNAFLRIRPSSLLPLLVLALTCHAFAFGVWTDWERFTSRNGVDIYVRVFRPKKGWSLRAQWRAVNNNSQAMWVGFGKKEYHLDNGGTEYGTSEGSDVRSQGTYTFVEDIVLLDGYGVEVSSVNLTRLEVRPSR